MVTRRPGADNTSPANRSISAARPYSTTLAAGRLVRLSVGSGGPSTITRGSLKHGVTAVVGRQNLRRAQIGDADAVLDLFRLLFTTVQAVTRPHQDLVLENLLLRHQLAVLTRPTRPRPRARLRLSDKLLWILVRQFCIGRAALVLALEVPLPWRTSASQSRG